MRERASLWTASYSLPLWLCSMTDMPLLAKSRSSDCALSRAAGGRAAGPALKFRALVMMGLVSPRESRLVNRECLLFSRGPHPHAWLAALASPLPQGERGSKGFLGTPLPSWER